MKKKGTTKSNGKKNIFDKFYTKDEVVVQCLSFIDNIKDFSIIVEPSAGKGAFLNHIKNKYIAFDIEPEDKRILKKDFLTLNTEEYFTKKERILVLGNPPFGTNGSKCLAFLKKSMSFANTVAFILPKSFIKESFKNKIDKKFHLIKEVVLNEDSFLLNGKSFSVSTVFQVWEKREIERKIEKKAIKTSLFSFVEKEKADFRVQRVGGNAGKASFDLNFSKSSNYFLKVNLDIISVDFLFNLINNISFEETSFTVGPKSLSKGELIDKVEKEFEKVK